MEYFAAQLNSGALMRRRDFERRWRHPRRRLSVSIDLDLDLTLDLCLSLELPVYREIFVRVNNFMNVDLHFDLPLHLDVDFIVLVERSISIELEWIFNLDQDFESPLQRNLYVRLEPTHEHRIEQENNQSLDLAPHRDLDVHLDI